MSHLYNFEAGSKKTRAQIIHAMSATYYIKLRTLFYRTPSNVKLAKHLHGFLKMHVKLNGKNQADVTNVQLYLHTWLTEACSAERCFEHLILSDLK